VATSIVILVPRGYEYSYFGTTWLRVVILVPRGYEYSYLGMATSIIIWYHVARSVIILTREFRTKG
jgi:hypothetical protein